MAIAKRGSVMAIYNPSNVADSVADDMVQIIQQISYGYPNDLFYNLAYPKLEFYLTKLNDEIGYQITLNGFGHVSDPALKFTKEMYHALNNKYNVSIIFLDSKHRVTLDYSDDKFLGVILQNHLFSFILIPIIVVATLSLCNHWMSSVSDQTFWGKLLRELIPVFVGYPLSFVAFKLQPMIPLTKILSWILILVSVFLFYLFTGSGLVGSLILLGIFILKSINSSLS